MKFLIIAAVIIALGLLVIWTTIKLDQWLQKQKHVTYCPLSCGWVTMSYSEEENAENLVDHLEMDHNRTMWGS